MFFLPLSVTIANRSKPSEVKRKLKGLLGICQYLQLEWAGDGMCAVGPVQMDTSAHCLGLVCCPPSQGEDIDRCVVDLYADF